jgi:hypothetical protein
MDLNFVSRLNLGWALLFAGVAVGGLQQIEKRYATSLTQQVSTLANATNLYAQSLKAFSFKIDGTLDSSDCKQHCSPEVLKAWSDAATTLHTNTATFSPHSAKASYVLPDFNGESVRIGDFLDKTRQPVQVIATTTAVPESRVVKLEADKLSLENENLRLQNEKLKLELADRPSAATKFLQSSGATIGWVLTTLLGLVSLSPGAVTSMRNWWQRRKALSP